MANSIRLNPLRSGNARAPPPSGTLTVREKPVTTFDKPTNQGNGLWATLAALEMAIGERNPPDLPNA
jgi:hypothetical protein